MNNIRIFQKLENKGYLIIEKDIIKREKITLSSLNKVSVSSNTSRWKFSGPTTTKVSVLAARVMGNSAILEQPETLYKKYFEFLY